MTHFQDTRELFGKLGPSIIAGSIVGLWFNTWTTNKILWMPFLVGLLVGFIFIYLGKSSIKRKNKHLIDGRIKIFSPKNFFAILVMIFVLILLIWGAYLLYAQHPKFEFTLTTLPEENLKMSDIECKSGHYSKLVSSDFPKCTFVVKNGISVDRMNISFQSYDIGTPKEGPIELYFLGNGDTYTITNFPVRGNGRINMFVKTSLSDENDKDKYNYDSVYKGEVLSPSTYQGQRTTEITIGLVLISLALNIPNGLLSLRKLYNA